MSDLTGLCRWPAKPAQAFSALGASLRRRAIKGCAGASFLVLAVWLLYVVLPSLRVYTGDILLPGVQMPGMTTLKQRLQLPEFPGMLQTVADIEGLPNQLQVPRQAESGAPTSRPALAKTPKPTKAQTLSPAQVHRQVQGEAQIRKQIQREAQVHRQVQGGAQVQTQAQRKAVRSEEARRHHQGEQRQQHHQQPGAQQQRQEVKQSMYPQACQESPMLPSCALPEFTLVAGGDLGDRLWQVCSGYAIRLGLRDMGWSTAVRVLWVAGAGGEGVEGPEKGSENGSGSEPVTGPGQESVKGTLGRSVRGPQGKRVKGPAAKGVKGSVDGRGRGAESEVAGPFSASVSRYPFESLFQPLGIVQTLPPSSPLFQPLLDPLKRTVTVPSCKDGIPETGILSAPGAQPSTPKHSHWDSPGVGSSGPEGKIGIGQENGVFDWTLVDLERGLRRADKNLTFTVFVSPRHVNFIAFDLSWACAIQMQFSRCFRKLKPTRALLSLLQAEHSRRIASPGRKGPRS